MVVSSAVELIFKETAVFTQRHAKAMAGKANRAIHGPRALAKERAWKVRERKNPKDNPKVPKAKGSCKDKTSKTGLSGLEYSKSQTSSETQESTQTYHSDNSYTDNSWFDDGLGTNL